MFWICDWTWNVWRASTNLFIEFFKWLSSCCVEWQGLLPTLHVALSLHCIFVWVNHLQVGISAVNNAWLAYLNLISWVFGLGEGGFYLVFLFETQCFWLVHDSWPIIAVWWMHSHTTVMDLNGTSSAAQAPVWRSRIELQLPSIIVPTTVLQRGQDRKCILHPVGFWEERLPCAISNETCLLPITAACLWTELRWLLYGCGFMQDSKISRIFFPESPL